MKQGFTDDQVYDIELELTGVCNLRCPLCANCMCDAEHLKRKNIRPLAEWQSQLDKYSNVKSVCLAGIFSEPTMYPELFELLDYLVQRRISFELYTNGDLHDDSWWSELSYHTTVNDKVVFTICGSTQELHERYRVGSKLDRIVQHAQAFKTSSGKCNDWVQHIKFNYNTDDFCKNMKRVISTFSNSMLINSSPYAERFKYKNSIVGVEMPGKLGRIYKTLAKEAYQRKQKNMPFTMCCKSFETHFISIEQFGKIYPCFLYRMYAKDDFSNEDFSDILSYKYDFCYECEKHTKELLEKYTMERMI